jgi:hypothetical protein
MTGVFTAGSVLTAANLNTSINSLTLNAQSGAGYGLLLADAGKLVTVSNATAQNLTIPLNATQAYTTGTVIEVLNIGAGTWTVTLTGGVTYTGPTSIGTSTRLRLTKTGTDTWYGSVLGGGGLTLVTSQAFTTSSAVNVNNCFTSTYENYKLLLTNTGSTTLNIRMRMRASATDDTSANYYNQSVNGNVASVTGAQETTQTSMRVATGRTEPAAHTIDVFQPQLAAATAAVSLGGTGSTNPSVYMWLAYHNVATAYDGFSLITSTGTITGTLRVYGYSNS